MQQTELPLERKPFRRSDRTMKKKAKQLTAAELGSLMGRMGNGIKKTMTDKAKAQRKAAARASGLARTQRAQEKKVSDSY